MASDLKTEYLFRIEELLNELVWVTTLLARNMNLRT